MIGYGIAYGPMDDECVRCRDQFDIKGVIVLDDDETICPNCLSPAEAQIVRALDAIHEAAVFDALSPAAVVATADALRGLADVIERISDGRLVVQTRAGLVTEPWEGGQLVGIAANWEITRTQDQEQP